MKLHHIIGEDEKTELEIERNCFTGNFVYRENGSEHRLHSPLNPRIHWNFPLTHEYEIEIGKEEKHSIKIIHTRPFLFAGFRPQTDKVLANGNVLDTYNGY